MLLIVVTADPSDSSPQDGSATGPALTFTVAGGRDDIISMWHTSLSRDEKHDILAIDVDELAHELDKLTGGVAILDASKIRELINNSEIMTAIRGMFVDALYNKGVMQVSKNNKNNNNASL